MEFVGNMSTVLAIAVNVVVFAGVVLAITGVG
jgi:hypothetical protein